MHYSHEATAGRAPGQPMAFTASGRFESAPVVRKRRGKSLSDGPIKLVRGGGWCDNCNAAAIAIRKDDNPVVENVEVAAAAGRGGGDDGDDDDDDNNDVGNQKPSGVGIILVPRAERRRDHQGMVSVTTIIGDRKRKATGGPAV